MNISGYCKESITEGDGVRSVIYISGCTHQCKGCFNQATWDFDYGSEFTTELQDEVISDIKGNSIVRGITLCGGDPFFSYREIVPFIKRFREECPTKTVWSYTGFTYEQALNSKMRELLELCDVLIDGRFVEEEKDLTLKYRGSRNQRIIDVQSSINKGEVVLWKSGESVRRSC